MEDDRPYDVGCEISSSLRDEEQKWQLLGTEGMIIQRDRKIRKRSYCGHLGLLEIKRSIWVAMNQNRVGLLWATGKKAGSND